MSKTIQHAVTTPDTQTAVVAAFARISAVPASLAMIDRISDADWEDDSLWKGDIACGSDASDPNELDGVDKVEAA